MKNKITQNIKAIILALVIVVGVSYVSAAWEAPTEAPTGGNVPAPINVGASAQYKEGSLTIGGTSLPEADYHLNVPGLSFLEGILTEAITTQAFTLVDSTPTNDAGKVLTSDANGNGTWQSVSGGGGNVNGIKTYINFDEDTYTKITWNDVVDNCGVNDSHDEYIYNKALGDAYPRVDGSGLMSARYICKPSETKICTNVYRYKSSSALAPEAYRVECKAVQVAVDVATPTQTASFNPYTFTESTGLANPATFNSINSNPNLYISKGATTVEKLCQMRGYQYEISSIETHQDSSRDMILWTGSSWTSSYAGANTLFISKTANSITCGRN